MSSSSDRLASSSSRSSLKSDTDKSSPHQVVRLGHRLTLATEPVACQVRPPRHDLVDMTSLTATYTLGSPQISGPLAVYPVFGPPPALDYRTLAEAIELGAFVKELERGASVGEVIVENPTDLAILIYEGEQIHCLL